MEYGRRKKKEEEEKKNIEVGRIKIGRGELGREKWDWRRGREER